MLVGAKIPWWQLHPMDQGVGVFQIWDLLNKARVRRSRGAVPVKAVP